MVSKDWRKANVNPIFIKEQEEGGARKLYTSQPHLCPREGDGTAFSGCHLQATGRTEGCQEKSTWIHQWEIMLDQSRSLV